MRFTHLTVRKIKLERTVMCLYWTSYQRIICWRNENLSSLNLMFSNLSIVITKIDLFMYILGEDTPLLLKPLFYPNCVYLLFTHDQLEILEISSRDL